MSNAPLLPMALTLPALVFGVGCGGEDPGSLESISRARAQDIEAQLVDTRNRSVAHPEVARLRQGISMVPRAVVLGPSTGSGFGGTGSVGYLDILNDVGFTRFGGLLRTTGLGRELDLALGPITVLVPEVTALDLYLDQPVDFDPSRPVLLRAFLEQHVVRESIRVEAGRTVRNSVGGEAELTGRFWLAANGVVAEVRQVIRPRFSMKLHLLDQGFELFAEAMTATNDVRFDVVAGLQTVLAPTDDAMLRMGWTKARLHEPAEESRVIRLLSAHLLGTYLTSELLRSKALRTVDGFSLEMVQITPEDAPDFEILIRDQDRKARLSLKADIQVSRGLIVSLDDILAPVP